jgi:hypothetical protein
VHTKVNVHIDVNNKVDIEVYIEVLDNKLMVHIKVDIMVEIKDFIFFDVNYFDNYWTIGYVEHFIFSCYHLRNINLHFSLSLSLFNFLLFLLNFILSLGRKNS